MSRNETLQEPAAALLTLRRRGAPSWFGWAVLPADTIVSDFPLTNRSCNLCYTGNDL